MSNKRKPAMNPATMVPPGQGIVADPKELNTTNYLTFNRDYSKIGSTLLLAADPAVVHFGGFQLDQVYKQTLRVRNISTTGTRVHIILPNTPFFKVWWACGGGGVFVCRVCVCVCVCLIVTPIPVILISDVTPAQQGEELQAAGAGVFVCLVDCALRGVGAKIIAAIAPSNELQH